MKTPSASLLRLLVALSCTGVGCLHADAVLAHEAKAHDAAWSAGSGYERSLRSYTIPDVVLVDADAQPVRLRELLASDDPVMVNFVFTTCSTICPVMVRVFADVPSRLGGAAKPPRMISISIDPEHDTPAQLKSYAANVGAGKHWRFLTGRVEAIKAVQRAFGTNSSDKMSHEPLTLLRAAPGKPWLRLDGFANPDELASEYRKLVLK